MLKNLHYPFLALMVIVVSLLFAGCGTSSNSIRISGSSTVLPVVAKAADLYRLKDPNHTLIVNAGGSGVGVNLLGEGQIDIGMISRDITDEEREAFPSVDFREWTIGADAVAVVISSEIFEEGVTQLSLEQIASIYLGEITSWKEVGGPDRDILVLDKEPSRGTRHVFAEVVLGDKKAPAPGADLILGSNNEEQTAIAQSDSAIGMLSLAWTNDDVKGVDLLVDQQLIPANLASIKDGTFPLKRQLKVITNGEPSPEVKEFIDFLLSPEGQAIVTEVGYVSIQE